MNQDDLRNVYRGKDIIVCGRGPSISTLPDLVPCLTIGVNDIWKHHKTRYICMIDGPKSFAREPARRSTIRNSTPELWLLSETCRAQWNEARRPRRPAVTIDDTWFPYCRNSSAIVATGMALWMGAKRIGLIGVDFTGDEWLDREGIVQLSFAYMNTLARFVDAEIWNLSEVSKLTLFPNMAVEAFLGSVGKNARQVDPEVAPRSTFGTSRVS